VDVEENLQYLMLHGYWKDASVSEEFHRYNRESIEHLKPGFITLVDISEIEAPSVEVIQEIVKTYSQRIVTG
jgi:hypothetical protein